MKTYQKPQEICMMLQIYVQIVTHDHEENENFENYLNEEVLSHCK